MATLTPAGSESSISGLLTCITCRVGFKDGDLQRDHYKSSEWHRYNLKRKMVNLPPVTAENFAERLALQERQLAEANKDTSQYCYVCKKTFGNDKAFQSHIGSKKHSLMVKECSKKDTGNVAVEGEADSDLSAGMKKKCSLIDSRLSSSPGKSSLPSNSGQKSPQAVSKFPGKGQKLGKCIEVVEDSDDDDDSWEEIQGDPIPVTSCLFCSEGSGSVSANLEHMSMHHSFFIPDVEYCGDIEGLLDYLGSKVGEGMICLWCNEKGKSFYDVHAVQQHMRDKGHCKVLHDAQTAFEYSDYYDYSSSYPADFPQTSADEPYQPVVLQYNEQMELVLPSGMTLGHRALKLYYRQYVRPGSRSMVELKKAKKHKILSQYKALGYGETGLQMAQMKLRDQRYFKEIKDKYHVRLGVQGNKNLQHYFRGQVMF